MVNYPKTLHEVVCLYYGGFFLWPFLLASAASVAFRDLRKELAAPWLLTLLPTYTLWWASMSRLMYDVPLQLLAAVALTHLVRSKKLLAALLAIGISYAALCTFNVTYPVPVARV